MQGYLKIEVNTFRKKVDLFLKLIQIGLLLVYL